MPRPAKEFNHFKWCEGKWAWTFYSWISQFYGQGKIKYTITNKA